jgi:hypothetical protein
VSGLRENTGTWRLLLEHSMHPGTEGHMATSIRSSHPGFSHAENIAATWAEFLLFSGRVLLGWSFLAVGYTKLGDIPATAASFTKIGLFLPNALALLVG